MDTKNESQIKSVIWHWNEGRNLGLNENEISLDAANEALWKIASEAPKNGCYVKVKFTANFEDGETYSGRFDVKHFTLEQETDTGALSLEGYIRHQVMFYIGERCPAHWSEEKYKAYIAEYGISEEEKKAWKQRIA